MIKETTMFRTAVALLGLSSLMCGGVDSAGSGGNAGTGGTSSTGGATTATGGTPTATGGGATTATGGTPTVASGGTNAISAPAEGAVSLSIVPSAIAPSGRGCTVTSQQTLFGDAPPGPTSQGSTWVDGQGGHKVKCSITGDGTFTFSGEISSNTMNLRVTGTVQAGGTGTAAVAEFDQGLALYDPNCTVDVSGGYLVENGAIWAGFSCSSLRSGDDTYQWRAAEETIVFKNCGG
jgi:hypothetical protein